MKHLISTLAIALLACTVTAEEKDRSGAAAYQRCAACHLAGGEGGSRCIPAAEGPRRQDGRQ